MEQTESITVPITVKPPKYQVTIQQNVRDALDIEGKESILQAELTVKKIKQDKRGDGN